jgi:hypothetical protein
MGGLSFSSQQPPPIPAFRFGSIGHDAATAMAVDSEGNVIMAGYFQNSVDFDPGPGTTLLQNTSGLDMVIAKYNRIGRLLWARDVGGNTEVVPHNICIDADDNIVIAGEFGISGAGTTSADFDPGPGTATLTTSGGRDPFVAKYDPDGNYVWARSLSATVPIPTDDRAWDVAVDADGNVYFCGELRGSFNLIPSSGSSQLYLSQGGSDIFVEKLDSFGNFVWGFGIGGAVDDSATSIAVDSSGHLFVSGTFSYNVDFDPGPAVSLRSSAGGTDVFVARFTTDGQFEEAISFGGPQSETTSSGVMRLDSASNLYLGGQFLGSIDFDPGSGQHVLSNTGSGLNSYVASYTSDLNLRWVFPLSSSDGTNGVNRVAVDSQQCVWVTGFFGGTTDFDGGGPTQRQLSKGQNGATDAFLAKYENTGAFLWARGLGASLSGSDNLTAGLGMILDPQDNAYLAGQFFGQVDFNPASKPYKLTSAGKEDGFVVKYDATGNLMPTLYFPRLLGDSQRYTGYAVANWGATAADVQFTAYNLDGSLISSPEGLVNPKTITIPPAGQAALLAEQIFNLPFDQPRNGWVRAESNSSQVSGFFLEGDTSLTYLDGAVASTQPSTQLVFTRGGLDASIFGSAAYTNRIDIVNPTSVAAQVTLKLIGETGIKGTATRSVPPLGRISEDLVSLFPSAEPAASKSRVAASSNVGIFGYQSVEGNNSLFSLPAQPPSSVSEFVSAQFVTGLSGSTAYFTNLSLTNTTSQIRFVQLTLVGNDGTVVAKAPLLTLVPGGHYQSGGDKIFGFGDPATAPMKEGSLVVIADGPGIVGDVVFGDPIARRFLASLPLDSEPTSNLVFSQVAEGGETGGKAYFTGIAILNPNVFDVVITLDVFAPDGRKTANASLKLKGGNRISKTLPELVPTVGDQLGGYIRLTSSGGSIFAFELFGDQNLDFLAAVPPQPITP